MRIISRKNEAKGVTLVSLVVTIIVLLILAGIGISTGKDVLQRAKLEELRTNMLLIQAKSREYVEKATFQMGINPDETKKSEVRNKVYIEEAKLEHIGDTDLSSYGITDTTTCYWLTPEAQTNWGLDKIELEENEKYIIQFNEADVTVEIYNTLGYDGQYSLTNIEQIQE